VNVGLLWRAEWDPPGVSAPVVETCRLKGVFAAFAELGVKAEPVICSDEGMESVRAQLLRLDGVLVWVNPIEQGLDRSRRDSLLRDVVRARVWVSAHPDVIRRMGTKEVLVYTAAMGWGTDTRIYRTPAELREQLPRRLSELGGPLVLKQRRGMGGNGVWKIELSGSRTVIAQHAADSAGQEEIPLDSFLEQCAPYFMERWLISSASDLSHRSSISRSAGPPAVMVCGE
jgi:hypothetical protein